jgi:hypothetical protein
LFQPIVDSLRGSNDYYILQYDFPSYLKAQQLIDNTYLDRETWGKMSVLSTAGCGKFSSDRTIHDYAREIWKIERCERPGPIAVDMHDLQNKGLVDSADVGNSPPNVTISIERLGTSPRNSRSLLDFE